MIPDFVRQGAQDKLREHLQAGKDLTMTNAVDFVLDHVESCIGQGKLITRGLVNEPPLSEEAVNWFAWKDEGEE